MRTSIIPSLNTCNNQSPHDVQAGEPPREDDHGGGEGGHGHGAAGGKGADQGGRGGGRGAAA